MTAHYVQKVGKGEQPLIFLPGTGWSATIGTPIAEERHKRFTTHLIDLPGIGKSDGLDGVKLQVDNELLNELTKKVKRESN